MCDLIQQIEKIQTQCQLANAVVSDIDDIYKIVKSVDEKMECIVREARAIRRARADNKPVDEERQNVLGDNILELSEKLKTLCNIFPLATKLLEQHRKTLDNL